MCIQPEIANNCSAVLHQFDRCGFAIFCNQNYQLVASWIPILSHNTEYIFAKQNPGGSAILKQHFLRIDRGDNRPHSKIIHSGSLFRALVGQHNPADFVLLVQEQVKRLSVAVTPSKFAAGSHTISHHLPD
jgi:hypothetical protein